MIEADYGYTKTPRVVIEDVVQAAEKAYKIVGESNGIDPEVVHRMGYCVPVLDEMGRALLDHSQKGYRAAPRRVTVMGMDHVYMSLLPPESLYPLYLERPIYADPTWQYYLESSRRRPELPKVLLGTSGEIVNLLQQNGFQGDQLLPWTVAKRRSR